MAQASLAELETQLEIAARLRYMAPDQLSQTMEQVAALRRQLYALRNAVQKGLGIETIPLRTTSRPPTPGP